VLFASGLAAWVSGFLVQVNNGVFSLEWGAWVLLANFVAIGLLLCASSREVLTGFGEV